MHFKNKYCVGWCDLLLVWCIDHHQRSGSSQTIFLCSSRMMYWRCSSRALVSFQLLGGTVRYRQGSLSSRGSSLREHSSNRTSVTKFWRSLCLQKRKSFESFHLQWMQSHVWYDGNIYFAFFSSDLINKTSCTTVRYLEWGGGLCSCLG